MCYTVSNIERKSNEYFERYKLFLPPGSQLPELPVFYFVSGFSHPLLPLITHEKIGLYEWGLIPFWIKNELDATDISNKTLNAVSETVFEKPSFRKSVLSQRALLGIRGFFEWRELNKLKYPYFIFSKENALFSLGCIYENWIDKETGEERRTFSILTTAANALMEKIHNTKKRMPLILSPKDEAMWINPTIEKDTIRSLIKPYQGNDLEAYTISKDASNSRNNRNLPSILDRVNYAEIRD